MSPSGRRPRRSPRCTSGSATRVQWTTRPSSRPPPTRPHRSSGWRRTRAAPWASTSCSAGAMRPASTTISPNTRTRAMKKVAGGLRLDLSQYRELEAFSQFGAELDVQTQRSLARGERMVATLNQPQYRPWPLEEQVVAIYAGTNGYLDDIPTPQVPRFQEELREHLKAEKTVYQELREGNDLTDELTARLNKELERFKGM